jgi:hypothetical protein
MISTTVTVTETTVVVMNKTVTVMIKTVVAITNTVTVITKTTEIIGREGLQIKSKPFPVAQIRILVINGLIIITTPFINPS